MLLVPVSLLATWITQYTQTSSIICLTSCWFTSESSKRWLSFSAYEVYESCIVFNPVYLNKEYEVVVSFVQEWCISFLLVFLTSLIRLVHLIPIGLSYISDYKTREKLCLQSKSNKSPDGGDSMGIFETYTNMIRTPSYTQNRVKEHRVRSMFILLHSSNPSL